MEENSDAHMETDVSSTTEDVLEMQEDTNSHGNVEMIIVVEEIKEEEDEKSGKRQSCDNNSVPQNIVKSPLKAVSMESVVLDSTIDEPQHPTQISPKGPTQPQEIPQSSSNNDIAEQSTLDNKTEVVDSSSTSEKQIEKFKRTYELINLNTLEQKSHVKETLPEEEVNIPPLSQEISTPMSLDEQTTEPTAQGETVRSNNIVIPVDITVEGESVIDSNIETNSDSCEKEHNKSISRELKSLINSAKESKIISECTQLTTKMRKSRTVLDSSNTSLNSPVEPDKLQGTRRLSDNSQKSNCSEKSDKNTFKRSMRSQNPEFVHKVKQFLNSVTGKCNKDDDITDDDFDDSKSPKEDSRVQVSSSTYKKRKIEDIDISNTKNDGKLRSDPFCWRCHWAVEQASEKCHTPMLCTVCPRTFHFKCLSSAERNKVNSENKWVCPDCSITLQAESSETRPSIMKKISLGMLCELLKYALERMRDLNGVEAFINPVDRTTFPDYDKYVVHPMDLTMMKSNIERQLYGSTEAFIADAQWILHNSIIFNTLQSKLTSGARALVRSCRAEMGEIEACPECYAAAHARRPTWFTDVCSTPHILLWAKLKGFPYWPAKGMSVSPAGLVDVRFFGAHDRAWVPAKDCFLYSEKDPNNFRTKRQDILDSMQEAEQHIRNISRKYGKFVYPPFKTQFEPSKLNEQLKLLIPSFEGDVCSGDKEKSSNVLPNSEEGKSLSNSKTSVNNGDISEAEEQSLLATSNVGEKSEATKEDISLIEEKDESPNVEICQNKEKESSSRKRRRSDLEEAVITILECGTSEKRKRTEVITKGKDTDSHEEPSSSKVVPEESKVSSEIDTELTKDSQKKSTEGKLPQEKKKTTEEEPSSSSGTTNESKGSHKKRIVTPIKIKIRSILDKPTDKEKNRSKSATPDHKIFQRHKTSTPKEDKTITQKDKLKRNKSLTECNKNENSSSVVSQSKGRRSLSNNSEISDKSSEKSVKFVEYSNNKNKSRDNLVKSKSAECLKPDNGKKNVPSSSNINKNNQKMAKTSLIFDDNTSLAVIARETNQDTVSGEMTMLPTISSVRSLSTLAQNSNTTQTNTSTAPKSTVVTIEATPDSSILTPTTTENVENRNVDDAVNKLQKLRNNREPMVGRVGVKAFARMTSPEKQPSDGLRVEIKAEPIELDEPDRHVEKMDLMNAFRLRPVNPTGLRDVRLNKVIVPLNRRAPTMPPDIRPRAKKTFPQPKKPEDSQLNGKNSMVYIPIQPPMTQSPLRMARPLNPNCSIINAQLPRNLVPISTPSTNSLVNTVTHPLVYSLANSLPVVTTSTVTPSIPTIGPTTVHTVPLMTSVNGQWMFSFQPVMSLGSVDSSPSQPPNGLPDRVPNAIMPAPSATNKCTPDVSAPGEPPRLQQRPLMNPLDPNAPIGDTPASSVAGPLTAKLNQNAVQLTDFFRSLIEESLDKMDNPAAQVTSLKLQLEQCKWHYQQKLDEITHNNRLALDEMRKTLENEKTKAVNEAKLEVKAEMDEIIKMTKSKQWCANCTEEAQFYCCWNTSYCDYNCQRIHWPQHFAVCTQQRPQDGRVTCKNGGAQSESRLQPQLDSMPKNSIAPTLAIGGKLGSRIFLPEQQPLNTPQKSSIIMSMVEDNSGNKTIKCVGTYTSTQKQTPPSQVPPLILNKQLLNEETNKKVVVTSGGYLIVGASASNPTAVSQSRRMHTIQYYT